MFFKSCVLIAVVISMSSCSLFDSEPDLYAADLEPATLNTYYSTVLDYKDNGNETYFRVTDGALPAGLTISRTGQIIGTPTEIGTFDFQVTLYEIHVSSSSDAVDAGDIINIFVAILCSAAEDGATETDCQTETDDEDEDDTISSETIDYKADTEWFELNVI